MDYGYWPTGLQQLPSPNNQPFQPPYDETKDCILWVHGWNMSPFDKDNYGDTAFKRLFWQGYKGRFCTFRWPTFHHDTYLPPVKSFDASEERAWNSGPGLLTLLGQLKQRFPQGVRLMAHSMGNVVAGEALRLGTGQVVHTYVASQAAISAHCYQANSPNMTFASGNGPSTPDVYGYHWEQGATSFPDQWQSEGRPSYMHSNYMSGKAGNYFNYYNDSDYALDWPRWQLDQQLKPDTDFWFDTVVPHQFAYGYQAVTVLTFPDNCYRIFAWAAESRSFALGAQWVAGVVDLNVDLKAAPFNYNAAHKYHSGQFRGTNMERRHYWEKFLIDCDLKEAE